MLGRENPVFQEKDTWDEQEKREHIHAHLRKLNGAIHTEASYPHESHTVLELFVKQVLIFVSAFLGLGIMFSAIGLIITLFLSDARQLDNPYPIMLAITLALIGAMAISRYKE